MRTLTVVNVLLWGALLWLGIDLIKGAQSQHVVGLPNAGQIDYYIRVPAAMLLGTLALFALARLTRFRRTALILQSPVLVCLVPFMLPYTGGI